MCAPSGCPNRRRGQDNRRAAIECRPIQNDECGRQPAADLSLEKSSAAPRRQPITFSSVSERGMTIESPTLFGYQAVNAQLRISGLVSTCVITALLSSSCLDFPVGIPGAGAHLRVPAPDGSKVVESSSLGKEPPPVLSPLSRARDASLQKMPDARP